MFNMSQMRDGNEAAGKQQRSVYLAAGQLSPGVFHGWTLRGAVAV
jgi:hypothetical protein